MQGKTQIQIEIQSQIPLNEKIQFFDEEGVNTATLLDTTDVVITETVEYVKLADGRIIMIKVLKDVNKGAPFRKDDMKLKITVDPVKELIGSEEENFSWTEATEKPTLAHYLGNIIQDELEEIWG